MAEGLPRRYEFRQTLGAGGEGQVSLVADLLRGGEVVVLKRLARDDPSEVRSVPDGRRAARVAEQIRREFRLLAGLRHPSLAPVHDFGLLRDGTAYFTRAFVAGEPLAAPPGGLDVPAAVRLLVGVCDALEPLHASGLLHGDIKPANVIVEPSGAVTLIDFSLARPQGAPDGLPSGTVAFMAPELLRGEPLDARADLYAVGVLAWYLLAGTLPFGPGVA
ncbi:MAG: serine/threonine protein kinase [Myxococcales bacterium]|nr:serine/threonine protein kinase [Myxococcales bacterium]